MQFRDTMLYAAYATLPPGAEREAVEKALEKAEKSVSRYRDQAVLHYREHVARFETDSHLIELLKQ